MKRPTAPDPNDFKQGDCESCDWYLERYDRSELHVFWNFLRQRYCVNPSLDAMEKGGHR